MTAPKRVQQRRTRGWRKPEGAVAVGRPSRWGNPFAVRQDEDGWWRATDGGALSDDPGGDGEFWTQQEARAEAVRLFRYWLGLGMQYPDLAPLRGRDLMCWCPLDAPCHADVLLELANT